MNVSESESFEEWVEAADRDPNATFFHTPPWFEAFCRTFPGMRTVLHRFEFEGGAIAFFPLIETRSRWLPVRRYRAGPAGCYGGWVAAPAPSSAACLRA